MNITKDGQNHINVKTDRRSLSQKTQKLVEAASVISNTLNILEGETKGTINNKKDSKENESKNHGQQRDSIHNTIRILQKPTQDIVTPNFNQNVEQSYISENYNNLPMNSSLGLRNDPPPSLLTSRNSVINQQDSVRQSSSQRAPLVSFVNNNQDQGHPGNGFNRTNQNEPPKSIDESAVRSHQTMTASDTHLSRTAPNDPVVVSYHPTLSHETSPFGRGYHDSPQLGSVSLESKRKIRELETEIATLKSKNIDSQHTITTLTSQCDKFKVRQHELEMKASRHNIEMRSLLDQNNLLRTENRRLIDQEATLKTKIIGLAEKPDIKPIALDAADEISKERIVQRIDEELGWLAVKTHEVQATKMDISIQQKQKQQLDMFKEVCESLKKVLKNVETSPKVKGFLKLLEYLVKIICQTCGNCWDLIQGTNELDEKIEKLHHDSGKVRKEAIEKIKRLNESHRQDVEERDHMNSNLKSKLNALTEKYKQILSEHEELIKQNDELILINEELEMIAKRPDHPPEVVLVPSNPDTYIHLNELEQLKLQNKDLQDHIEHLTITITNWKAENNSLQDMINQVKAKKNQLEKESLKQVKEIGEYESQINDEKLKNQKLTELIKSLQNQLQDLKTIPKANDYHKTILVNELEKTLESQITSIKEKTQSKEAKNSILTQEGVELEVLKYMKFMDDKTERVKALEQKLQDLLNQLEEANIRLKTKSVQAKEKFHVRESTWLNRIKKNKQDYEELKEKYDDIKDCLTSYLEQFQDIQALLKETDIPYRIDNHPLPFSKLFISLHSQTVKLSNECTHLNQSIKTLKSAQDENGKQLAALNTGNQSMKTEKLELDKQIKHYQTQCKEKQSQIHVLENQLSLAEEARVVATDRLKQVIAKAAVFVGVDF
ncbi:hypothetical protein BC833DRAFT_103038 [Globomyces pollinis-pini]|nr:hypothetical protein BC833DRAFT_103038 [Globomyces pollinis-pini]